MRPEDAVAAFNAAINRQDLAALGEMMADDHEFIDTSGSVERGKAHCLEVWQGFFTAFPDYRNTFTNVTSRNGVVTVVGYSTCSLPALDGPALWQANVVEDKVAQWRVYDDTTDNRVRLGIAAE